MGTASRFTVQPISFFNALIGIQPNDIHNSISVGQWKLWNGIYRHYSSVWLLLRRVIIQINNFII